MSLNVKTRTNGDDGYFTCDEKAENWCWGIKSTCHWRVYMMIGVAGTALKVIGTHNGTFHCDEALAVYMLRLTEAYQDAGYSYCL